MKTFQTSIFLLLICLGYASSKAIACLCSGIPTTEEAFKRSELVVTGRIVGMDTIYSANTLVADKKGLKVGKRKYKLYEERFVRVKILVEKKYKSSTILPDTIYVLTEIGCGVHFTPFFEELNSNSIRHKYIVYGDKWVEKTLEKIKKRKKYVGQIKIHERNDTFYTTMCSRTQPKNDDELKRLDKIKI